MPLWYECICGHPYEEHDAHPNTDACRYDMCPCDWFVCDHDRNDCECGL